MKIGIDARFWGLEHAGLGRYVMELVTALNKIDHKNQYILFVRKPYDRELELSKNFRTQLANIHHYSIEEQWLLAEVFGKENLDLLHVPHFNVPLLYRRPFILTIHDLLWHEVRGLSVTTQNPFLYLTKYMGYKIVVSHALKNAKHILVPSNAIREKLSGEHRVNRKKITVTYEAPSKIFIPQKKKRSILAKYKLSEPFIIYTGSAYPHKNILAAAEAVKIINERGMQLSLAIASARSIFLERLKRELRDRKLESFVRLIGFVPDYDLVYLYVHAKALILPSRSEGFGLTGLEAMAAGLPVVASKLKVFEEIYNDAALYFDQASPEDIASKLEKVLTDKTESLKLVRNGRARVKQFSWDGLAQQTLKVYRDVVKS